jgi:hypothetical protein
MKWTKIHHAKRFVPVSVILAVLVIGGAVFAAGCTFLTVTMSTP